MTANINEAKRLSGWIDDQLHGLDLPNNLRVRLAGGLLHIALEHAGSILLLAEHRRYASGAALLRAALESYVRGAWLYYSATDAELDRFRRNDTIDKYFGTLVTDLEEHDAFSEGVLSAIKAQSWTIMNSMAHGGMEQLCRRLTTSEIKSRFDQNDVATIVDSAAITAILSGIAVAAIAGDNDLAEALYEGSGRYLSAA